MCPVLDFANHTPASTLVVPVFPPPNTVAAPGSKARRGDYAFLSSRETQIAKDEELFLKYGSHPNRTLFIEYGFVNPWKEGECASGEFIGEVDLQDVVEALFEEKGAMGAWMKEVLQQEGYWGDWTLHSSPPPAYPSYRLVTLLRLYQLFADCAQEQEPPPDSEARLARWRSVLAGRSEYVSKANEDGWRAVLIALCVTVGQRAREGLKRVEEPLLVASEKSPGWLPWMLQNIRLLWLEELEVAEAVVESVRAGIDF
ncbi:hypothetical protein EIP86_004105 [Pleurotus ostreatoroseus]|nr:hypothetical protein EIP86_004105 [Pleurotus ostreatoroseus]